MSFVQRFQTLGLGTKTFAQLQDSERKSLERSLPVARCSDNNTWMYHLKGTGNLFVEKPNRSLRISVLLSTLSGIVKDCHKLNNTILSFLDKARSIIHSIGRKRRVVKFALTCNGKLQAPTMGFSATGSFFWLA